MAKIERYDGNLKAFASEQLGVERTLFGRPASADDLTSQITPEFLRGWGIVGPSDQPSLQDFNAATYTNGQLIAYLHQMGVAEYNAGQEYFSGSITQAGGVLYLSLVDANIGNAPASSLAQWRAFVDTNDSRIAGAIQSAGAGLTKTGTTLSVNFGAGEGTAVQGNDPRLSSIVTSISGSASLTAGQLGLVLADSTVSPSIIDLPASNATLGVRDIIVRRTDNTGNRLKIQAAANDKIKFHTHLNATGYPFLVLMGAGDWWHLRSDGAGGWWPIGRHDATPLGRPVFDTATAFPPGGYGAMSGPLLVRAEWPWLWDHAQQSGMLTTEAARVGMEGCWTSGDGVATFRGPEGRGEFLRVLDDGRGVDVGRLAGSFVADAFQGHRFNLVIGSGAGTGMGGGSSTGGTNILDGTTPPSGGRIGPASTDGVNGTPRVSSETRPRSIAYPGRIKLI